MVSRWRSNQLSYEPTVVKSTRWSTSILSHLRLGAQFGSQQAEFRSSPPPQEPASAPLVECDHSASPRVLCWQTTPGFGHNCERCSMFKQLGRCGVPQIVET